MKKTERKRKIIHKKTQVKLLDIKNLRMQNLLQECLKLKQDIINFKNE